MIGTYILLAFCLIPERTCTFLEDLKAAATVCTEKFPIPIDELTSLRSLILSKAYLPPKRGKNKHPDFTLEKSPRIEDYFDRKYSDKIARSSEKGKGLASSDEFFKNDLGNLEKLNNSNSRLISKINSNGKLRKKLGKYATNSSNINDINSHVGTSSSNKSAEIKKSEIVEVEDRKSRDITSENIEDEITKWRNTDSSNLSYDSFSPFSDGLKRMDLDKPYSALHDNDVIKSIYKKSAQYQKFVKNMFLTLILDFCLGNKKNYSPDKTYQVSNYPKSKEEFIISESPDTSGRFIPEDRRLLALCLVVRYLYECLYNYDDREKKVALQLSNLTPKGSLTAWVEYYVKNIRGIAGDSLEKKYDNEKARGMEPNPEDSQEELSYVCKVSLKEFYSGLIHFAKCSILAESTKNCGICQLYFVTGEYVILAIEKSFTHPNGFFISVLRSTQPKIIVEFAQLSAEKKLLVGDDMSLN